MSRPVRPALALAFVLAGVAPAQWIPRFPALSPTPRFEHALATDCRALRALLFGGLDLQGIARSDLWSWDGSAWTEVVQPVNRPPARWGHAMVYDPLSGLLRVAGGVNPTTGLLSDSWDWDGTAWLRTAYIGERTQAAMAWDERRQNGVLFGGFGTTGVLGDTLIRTWTWSPVTPAAAPPPRYSHAMAFDARRGVVTLFGGKGTGGVLLADTWEWDGTNWTDVSRPARPPARRDHALVFDPAVGRIILYGGWAGAALADTWEWDGTAWSERPAAPAPAPREGTAMVFDAASRRTLLFGGLGAGLFGDTWTYASEAPPAPTPPSPWLQALRCAAPAPAARARSALAFDSRRGRAVLFGGTIAGGQVVDETWETDGESWFRLSPPVRPPARSGAVAAYDSGRGVVVLFGGLSPTERLGDTWEWDGSTWTPRVTAPSPPARELSSLAYDAARGEAVLFGGTGVFGHLNDTWVWDGTHWILRAPPGAPLQRTGPALAYDAARQRVVLCGGAGLNDTWEWDGFVWRRAAPVVSPTVRYGHAVAYDALRQRVVLFGGVTASPASDTWEWDGRNWARAADPAPPPARYEHAMTWDAARGRVLLFGGLAGLNAFLGDAWAYVRPPDAVAVEGRVLARSSGAGLVPMIGAVVTVTQGGLPVATGVTGSQGGWGLILPPGRGAGAYTIRASIQPVGHPPVCNYRYPDPGQAPVLDPAADRIALSSGPNPDLDVWFPAPVLLVHDLLEDQGTLGEAESLFRLDPQEKSARLGIAHRGYVAWGVTVGPPSVALWRTMEDSSFVLEAALSGRVGAWAAHFSPPAPAIDLMAHGSGGLLARWWLSNRARDNGMDRLFLLGTPNLGLSWLFGASANPALPPVLRVLDPIHLTTTWTTQVVRTRGARFVLIGSDRNRSCEPECVFPGLPPEDDGWTAQVSALYAGAAPGTVVRARLVTADRHHELLSETPNQTITRVLLAGLETLR